MTATRRLPHRAPDASRWRRTTCVSSTTSADRPSPTTRSGRSAIATTTRSRSALSWADFDGAANRDRDDGAHRHRRNGRLSRLRRRRVVGWMNAQPYHKLRHACARMRIAAAAACRSRRTRRRRSSASSLRPRWRRRGVARALLAGAIDDLAARGIRARRRVSVECRAGGHGRDRPLSRLAVDVRRGGFAPIATHENVTVVRKLLR